MSTPHDGTRYAHTALVHRSPSARSWRATARAHLAPAVDSLHRCSSVSAVDLEDSLPTPRRARLRWLHLGRAVALQDLLDTVRLVGQGRDGGFRAQRHAFRHAGRYGWPYRSPQFRRVARDSGTNTTVLDRSTHPHRGGRQLLTTSRSPAATCHRQTTEECPIGTASTNIEVGEDIRWLPCPSTYLSCRGTYARCTDSQACNLRHNPRPGSSSPR